MKENKLKIPPIPFYFARHGNTDWNKEIESWKAKTEVMGNGLKTGEREANANQWNVSGLTE